MDQDEQDDVKPQIQYFNRGLSAKERRPFQNVPNEDRQFAFGRTYTDKELQKNPTLRRKGSMQDVKKEGAVPRDLRRDTLEKFNK